MKKTMIRNSVLILLTFFMFAAFMPMAAFSLNYKYGNFPDVADNHWAKQVITKMNLRSVVKGIAGQDGINYFKPNDTVSQRDAVIMALRTKLDLQTKESLVDTSRSLSFDVPSWAKGAMLVAVDEGLIVDSNFQHSKEATRAWVAQLLVRLIGKQYEVSSVSNEILPFEDAYAIPTEYLNYIKVAYKYGLISGSNNKLEPNQPVTRAQMVAFLSRVEKYLPIQDSNVIIGKITAINSSNVTVLSDNGTEYTLVCNISTNLFGENGQEIWVTDLKINDRVYVIVDGNIIKYLDMNPPQTTTTSGNTTNNSGSISTGTNSSVGISGKILTVYSQEGAIVIKTDEGLRTINLAKTTVIQREEDGARLGIDSLVKDGEVNVLLGNDNIPTKIIVKGTGITQNTEGVVYDIDFSSELIAIKGNTGLTVYEFDTDAINVDIDNKRLAVISDIKVGDKVQVDADSDGVISSIKLLVAQYDLELKGTVKLEIEDRIITFIDSATNELKVYEVTTDADIDFSGERGSLDDIRVGDEIEVKIEESKIVSISVTNRELDERIKGTLYSIDPDNRIITLKDNTDELKVYEVSESARIVIEDDDDESLDDLEKDMPVEIELYDGEVIYIEVNNAIEGEVLRVNDSKNIIELKLDTGERQTYLVDNDVDINMEDVRGADLDDLDDGDNVEIIVEDNLVTEINVERSIIYEVVDDAYSSKLRVEDEDGDRKYLYVDEDDNDDQEVDFFIPGIENPRLKDFHEGDVIKATFLGDVLLKIEKLPQIIGYITDINYRDEITVKDYDDEVVTISFTSGSEIIKNDRTYNDIDKLAVGDRVIVTDSFEAKSFKVIEKKSGTLISMATDKSKIYLKLTSSEWKYYDLASSAYIHQGSVLLNPSDFVIDDKIDIYLIDDKVYEVVKK